MGSISSRPQVPAMQQPVIVTIPQPVQDYAPPPVAEYIPPATTKPPASDDANAPPISEEAKSAARAEGLLNRNRGLLGTVMTSFRGLLNQGGQNTRKTLLGE